MSYILDALKKSEKERNKKMLPDILTVPEENIKKKSNLKKWYIIVISFLILFVISIFSLKNNYKIQVNKELNLTNKPSKINSFSLSQQDTVMDNQVQNNIKKSDGINLDNKINKSEFNAEKHMGLSNTKNMDSKQEQKIQTTSKLEVLTDEPKKDEKTIEAEEPEVKPEKDKIYTINELPPQILKKIPSLKLSILLYSDEPSNRIVRINGYTLKEGQVFLNDILVEEILNDGVILNYRDFKFKLFNK